MDLADKVLGHGSYQIQIAQTEITRVMNVRNRKIETKTKIVSILSPPNELPALAQKVRGTS